MGGAGLSFNGVSALFAGFVVFAHNQVIFQGECGEIYMSECQCSYTTCHGVWIVYGKSQDTLIYHLHYSNSCIKEGL